MQYFAGTNTSITDNYIISKDYYGNGAILKTMIQ